jgi:hypothetical protein
VPRGELLLELPKWVDRWIHFAAETLLGGGDHVDHFVERDIADDHEIDIARRAILATCHRSIDEGEPDLRAKGGKCLAQDICQPSGFQHDAAQIGKDRTVRVRLKEDVRTAHRSPDDTHLDQRFELPLHGAEADVGPTDNLAKVEGLSGVA